MTETTDSIVKPLPSEMKTLSSNVMEISNNFDVIKKNVGPLARSLSAMGSKDRIENSGLSETHSLIYSKMDELRRATYKHSWTRATAMMIARSAVGSGFSFEKHPIFGDIDETTIGDKKVLKPIYEFFYGVKGELKYIQNIQPLASKMLYTVLSFVLYGQFAWEIIYDKQGNPVGFDVLAGIVFPNVDKDGKFKNPAYLFRPWNSYKVQEYKDPKKIVFVSWPGTDMNIHGATEYLAATESAIPSDLYAATTYRAHFENVNAPYNGIWVVDRNTSEEDFKKFMSLLFNRYSGVRNFGRNPLVIKGNAEFKEMRSRSNDDAPYLEGRKYNQEEISALSGVSSAKLGLSADLSKANFRDMRREFHENTLRPIYETIEQAIYQQVFVRAFGIEDWLMTFNRPDLTNAIEDATIYTRYLNSGIMNFNEVRAKLGLPPRKDGDEFVLASNLMTPGEQTSPEALSDRDTQNRSPDGGSPRQADPVRPATSDRPDLSNDNRDKMITELRTWKKFAQKISKGKRGYREFVPEVIDKEIADQINNYILDNIEDDENISNFFNEIIVNL